MVHVALWHLMVNMIVGMSGIFGASYAVMIWRARNGGNFTKWIFALILSASVVCMASAVQFSLIYFNIEHDTALLGTLVRLPLFGCMVAAWFHMMGRRH